MHSEYGVFLLQKVVLRMKTSRFSNAVTPSLTRKLFNMAKSIGNSVIDLTLGDPDLQTPPEIRDAALEAISGRLTMNYSANAGLPELREVYSSFFNSRYNFPITPDKNLIVTVGGMEALFLALSSIIDSGDEVIIMGPYYVNYLQMIRMCEGIPVIIDRLGKNSQETAQAITDSITPKTAAIIINSPCNPVGDILPDSLLRVIAETAIKHNLAVISDEVYNSLVYDGKKASSIYDLNGMPERTIVIDSCSKRFAMTGWRVGFAAGPEDVIANMTKLQENVAACAPLPSQYAAIRAYRGGFDYSYIRDTFQKRRDVLVNGLAKIPGISFINPEAAFYCFINIGSSGMDCENFAYSLLEHEHVAVVPGTAYGEKYSEYIRLAFTVNEKTLLEALGRISHFFGGVTK